jgi:hypothetical protein
VIRPSKMNDEPDQEPLDIDFYPTKDEDDLAEDGMPNSAPW